MDAVTTDQDTLEVVPARSGRSVRMSRGERIKLINTHGTQVVDTWAFSADDITEFMSVEHSRGGMLKVNPRLGDTMCSNRRRAILTIVDDTSPGEHDTLIGACDCHRYKQLGCEEYHDNCTDNLHAALASEGLETREVPSPVNLFMYVPISPAGTIEFAAPLTSPGDYVVLKAEMDLILVMSACPQDITPVNGLKPREVHFSLLN